jgi:hypothetical protein
LPIPGDRAGGNIPCVEGSVGKGHRGVLSKATYIDDILGRIFDIPNDWEKPAEFAKSWGAVE